MSRLDTFWASGEAEPANPADETVINGVPSAWRKTASAHLIGGRTMTSRMNQGPRGSVKSGRFEALLDKLVAVQMDLEPVCGVGTERAQVVASLHAIADACHVLRSAIADVRNIIHQADGLMDLPEAVPALD
jgi:hypothetical protein